MMIKTQTALMTFQEMTTGGEAVAVQEKIVGEEAKEGVEEAEVKEEAHSLISQKVSQRQGTRINQSISRSKTILRKSSLTEVSTILTQVMRLMIGKIIRGRSLHQKISISTTKNLMEDTISTIINQRCHLQSIRSKRILMRITISTTDVTCLSIDREASIVGATSTKIEAGTVITPKVTKIQKEAGDIIIKIRGIMMVMTTTRMIAKE